MIAEWASIYIIYDASITLFEKAWTWHEVPVPNHLMETESEFAPWDLSKAHILVSTPEHLSQQLPGMILGERANRSPRDDVFSDPKWGAVQNPRILKITGPSVILREGTSPKDQYRYCWLTKSKTTGSLPQSTVDTATAMNSDRFIRGIYILQYLWVNTNVEGLWSATKSGCLWTNTNIFQRVLFEP